MHHRMNASRGRAFVISAPGIMTAERTANSLKPRRETPPKAGKVFSGAWKTAFFLPDSIQLSFHLPRASGQNA
jgi:hypothetical protein